jgi:hypothetical protein
MMMKITALLLACAVITVAADSKEKEETVAKPDKEPTRGNLDASVDDFLTSVDLQDRVGKPCTADKQISCARKYNSGKLEVCGWSSCRECDVCATAAPSPKPPRAACATLPAPTYKKPKDVIPSLGVNWKLQTPCQDGDLTAVDGGYQCKKMFNKLRRGGNKAPPKIHSVKVGSDLGEFTLTSKCYTKEGRKIRTAAFYTAKDAGEDMVVFYTPTVGITTSGSVSPRVELRQEIPSKGWSVREHHTFELTAKVVEVPSAAKSVAVMQIFNSGPFVEVMTRICNNEKMVDGSDCVKGELYMMVFMTQYKWANGDTPNEYTMLAKYELGTKFNLKVEVNDGAIDFKYKPEGGTKVEYSAVCKKAADCWKQDGTHAGGLHFKAGAYLQKIGTKGSADYGLPYVINEAVDDYALVYVYDTKIIN